MPREQEIIDAQKDMPKPGIPTKETIDFTAQAKAIIGSNQWYRATVGDLLNSKFGKEEVENVRRVISAMADILVAAAEIVAFAAQFLAEVVDIISNLVKELLDLIRDFISDLMNTGVYTMVYTPRSWHERNDYEVWKGIIRESIFDINDSMRPIFSKNAPFAAAHIMGAAPNIEGLIDVLKLFAALFNMAEFDRLVSSYDLWRYKANFAKIRSTGFYPDWASLSLADAVKPFGFINEGLGYLYSALDTIDQISSFVKQVADEVARKAAFLAYIIKRLAEEIDDFIQMLLASGFYFTAYSMSSGGSAGFLLGLDSLASPPDFPAGGAYIASMSFMVGGPGVGGFKNWFKTAELDFADLSAKGNYGNIIADRIEADRALIKAGGELT